MERLGVVGFFSSKISRLIFWEIVKLLDCFDRVMCPASLVRLVKVSLRWHWKWTFSFILPCQLGLSWLFSKGRSITYSTSWLTLRKPLLISAFTKIQSKTSFESTILIFQILQLSCFRPVVQIGNHRKILIDILIFKQFE